MYYTKLIYNKNQSKLILNFEKNMKLKILVCFFLFILIYSCSQKDISSSTQKKKVYVNIFEDSNSKVLKDPAIYSQGEILKILETPNLIKKTNDIQMWQYKGEKCILNFIWINPKDNINQNKIVSYNLDKKEINYKKCYQYLLQEFNIIK